ncbi:CLUMA_CG001914, isoform A [Clunio marinus]|uniref:CLUMA_CG001914, isoform A n=1 Tax=Clunio marinus TaxID=568069 RepID=A0A1J1HPI8_9DIPT|nr:CLUMA_CG001914, isoform A [Clunio marinus]
MSREKDSAIVYELVTSKYKIAERNRLAKYRFLNEMKGETIKRRDSEPTIAQTEKAEVDAIDLSVPGTPVSSRYIASLKKNKRYNHFESDSETENEDDDKLNDNPSKFHSQLEDGLKKFTADMEKLQNDVESHDPLQKYFEDSDKKKTFRRDFSEVVQEFSTKKKEPEISSKIEEYFQESERMKSFKRDFTEVVRTFDPKNPSGREQFTDLMKPGTPISSRLVTVEKLSSTIDNKYKIDNEIIDNLTESNEKNEAKPSPNESKNNINDVMAIERNDVKVIETEVTLKIIEDDDKIKIQPEVSATQDDEMGKRDASSDEKVKKDVPKLKRSDSTSSNISIPGTPISSRALSSSNPQNGDSDDSGSEGTYEDNEIAERAKEFVHEIENLVQKSFEDDDDRQEIVLGELKKLTNEIGFEKLSSSENESEKKLIIHEEQNDNFNPNGLENKVEDYFERSQRDNTYSRTFSEVENFNEVSEDVKKKVDDYFKQSEVKKSFTRPFSLAVNYVEPKIDIDELLKPGTPISSKDLMSLKKENNQQTSIEEKEEIDPEILKGEEVFKKAKDALHESQTFTVDDYFKQSQDRKTYRRDFSEVLSELHPAKPTSSKPEIEEYFEKSETHKTFQRTFSEAHQTVPPSIDEILTIGEKKKEAPLHYQRSSRASSISSNCSEQSEGDNSRKSKKHGKKYGIDKYFAASLYRNAYHRSNSRRESKDDEYDELRIMEDEDVLGDSDLLRQREFQHDDETRVTQESNDVNENQSVHFWREFLKPYNLNLQTDIKLTKEELLNNRTLE